MGPIYHQYQGLIKDRAAPLLPATPADIEGPFYKPGAPGTHRLCPEPTLVLRGRVLDRAGNPVPLAELDFWQADPNGVYDNDGFRYRGKLACDELGQYALLTDRPGCYHISDSKERCPHIHVKVTGAGCKALTTQLYFPGAPNNQTDPWFDGARTVRSAGVAGEVRFDFVLERE